MKRELLSAVLAHELFHSFTSISASESPNTRFKNTCRGIYHSIIEESLATYYTLDKLLDLYIELPTITLTNALIDNLPIEYRAELTWLYSFQNLVNDVVKLWTRLFTNPYKTSILQLYSLIRIAILDTLDPNEISEALRDIFILKSLAIEFVRTYTRQLLPKLFPNKATIEKLEDFLWRTTALTLATSTPTPTINPRNPLLYFSIRRKRVKRW